MNCRPNPLDARAVLGAVKAAMSGATRRPLTPPTRVAVDNGQAGMKERHQARTKELDNENSNDRGTPPRSARGNGEMEVGLPGAREHW